MQLCAAPAPGRPQRPAAHVAGHQNYRPVPGAQGHCAPESVPILGHLPRPARCGRAGSAPHGSRALA